ncbi:unnamed protein product [Sphagnum balticum]
MLAIDPMAHIKIDGGPRSLRNEIVEPAERKEKSPLLRRKSKLLEIEDNMNGYLTFKQHPEQPIVFLPSQRTQVASSPASTIQNKSTPIPEDVRTGSRLRSKGYMFKALARMHRR